MNVTGLSWMTFRLPLRAPFRTASGVMTHREGLLLRLVTASGYVGLGEASPHPAVAPGAVQELEAELARVGPQLIGADVECLPDVSLPPLACAIDTAALDLLAQDRGISVAALLSDRARSSVTVNATIGTKEDEAAADEARAAVEAGFTCVKLKVGIADSVAEECLRVAAVRHALGPDIYLRLDANGAWSEQQAIATITALEEYGLEFVEQPVAAGDLAGLQRVRRSVSCRIAADESITSLDTARRVLELEVAQVLVVKPMVVGGLRPAMQIADAARKAGVATVITTTIDAGVGTAAALHLAAALPEGGPACGLATGSLLAGDIVTEQLQVREGQVTVPVSPGLGVALDEEKLAQYGGVEHTLP
jgi:o-succinylbenzoate synthase